MVVFSVKYGKGELQEGRYRDLQQWGDQGPDDSDSHLTEGNLSPVHAGLSFLNLAVKSGPGKRPSCCV